MNSHLKNLKPSSTLELNQLAKSLASQGKSIVNLTAGEPDFNTPDRIIAAAEKAMRQGKTKYTAAAGIAELRSFLVDMIQKKYGRSYSAKDIVVTNGGKQAIFNICFTLLNPGDEVILPTPCWVSYESMVEMVGATPVTVPSGIEKHFEPDIAAIEKAITPKSKLLIINSPNNPSGAVFSEQFFEQLDQLLSRHPQLFVLTDDIYEVFAYEQPFYSIGMSKKLPSDRLFIVSGVSKTFSMTGWRLGYVAGPSEIMKVVADVQSQTTSNVNTITQWAALEAYQGEHQTELTLISDLFQKRRNLAFEGISRIPGIECIRPQGAFYIFPKVTAFLGKVAKSGTKINTDVDLSTYLIQERGVATVPGSAFALPGYIRLSYVLPEEPLVEGVRRIADGLRELK